MNSKTAHFTASNPLLRGVEVGSLDLQDLLETAKKAALSASKQILKIYNSGDFSIEAKADNSPLTLADKASHEAIVKILEGTNLPVLSEEGASIPFEERKDWEYFWMIDPLDGTKEFIKKNGEFTVNIALIHHQKPVLGVVNTPVLNEMHWATQGQGAFKDGSKIHVNTFDYQDIDLRVVASRSHLNADTEEFLKALNRPYIVSKGSSLKLLMVAEGRADLYPRYAPTMEWDTAAAQIIVEEAGGKVLQRDSQDPVRYNKQDLLNPHFLVTGNSL
ncbi:MAG: 3'(2'),5'-bisphosphate nucleotidase CysQ [Cyclobacteriaceae bacterium]|nr:3'(2'),5'-bisphosphate nucleotidase CysQ [Cyclobacteriaceae bacterium HetDA_MAG_MS6]